MTVDHFNESLWLYYFFKDLENVSFTQTFGNSEPWWISSRCVPTACELYQPILKWFARNVFISALQGAQSQPILLLLTGFSIWYKSLLNGFCPLCTALFFFWERATLFYILSPETLCALTALSSAKVLQVSVQNNISTANFRFTCSPYELRKSCVDAVIFLAEILSSTQTIVFFRTISPQQILIRTCA